MRSKRVEFDSPDWDSVPDVGLDGRTRPKHPALAPGGLGWHEFFQKLKAEGVIGYGDAKARKAAESDDQDSTNPMKVYKDYAPIQLTQPAEEFDDPCGPLSNYVKLGLKNGWELISLAHSRSFAEGLPYASGQKEGAKRGDRDIELQWVHFKRDGNRASILYTLFNGIVYGTAVRRYFNGEALSDSGMKEKMKR